MSIYDDLGLLGDATRVRMLRILEREELGVGELARVLQLPQSTVSRQLKALHQADWVTRRAEGTSAFVSFPDEAPNPELWALVRDAANDAATFRQDLARLDAIVAQRQTDARDYYGRVASRWAEVRRELFGEAFQLPALLALLPPEWTLGDLGCGPGETAAALAPFVAAVIGVDQEPAMLEAAARRVEGFGNVDLRHGDLTALPIDDAVLDAALLSLVLHVVPEVPQALAEARRALKPSGRLVILDMLPHDRDEYRRTMGHVHLGFSRDTLAADLADAGLALATFRPLPPAEDVQGPALFVATAQVVENASKTVA